MLEVIFLLGAANVMFSIPLMLLKSQSADITLSPRFYIDGAVMVFISTFLPLYAAASFSLIGGWLAMMSAYWTATVNSKRLHLNGESINLNEAKIIYGGWIVTITDGRKEIRLCWAHSNLKRLEPLCLGGK